MDTTNQDYFPLIPGLILDYEGEEIGEPTSTSKFEILNVTKKWPTPRIYAQCRNTWAHGGDTGSRDIEIVKRIDDIDHQGIFEGGRLLLPLPLKIGYSWAEYPLQFTVDSFDATTVVPAGEFRHCLYIKYLIAGGDAGWGRRFYAPGIGLVREDYSGEASGWSRILINHNVPYHVFIAHATEDKEAIARPLADELKARGLRVWYDEFTLRIGDSLNQVINHGLSNSWYGVVILSYNFFHKSWPQRELNGLMAKEVTGEKVILPVWHRVTYSDVLRYSPILADKKAADSAKGIAAIADDIAKAIL